MRGEAREVKSQSEFGAVAMAMEERLRAWCRAHPEATFDEIAEQVSQERKQLMGGLLSALADEVRPRALDPKCPGCGGVLVYKGKKSREVLHREGQVRLSREYYYCAACRQGVFPPRP
jgi:hypothetical protein